MNMMTKKKVFKEKLENHRQEQKAKSADERLRLKTDSLKTGKLPLVMLLAGPDRWTNRIFLVSESGEHALVGLARVTTGSLHARLDDLVVFSHLRGLGIGRAALEAIVDSARAAGLRSLTWCFGVEDHPCVTLRPGSLPLRDSP